MYVAVGEASRETYVIGETQAEVFRKLLEEYPYVSFAFNELFETLKEKALAHDCNCPQCKQIKEALIGAESSSTKQNNEEKLDILLKDFLRGEL